MAFPFHAAKRAAFIVKRLSYLLTFGQAKTANRDLLRSIAKELGWGRLSPVLPKTTLTELLAEPPAVRLMEVGFVRYNVSLYELYVLSSLVAGRGCRELFEIGTFDGRTTLNLAANTSDESRIHTLDLPPEDLGYNHAQVGTRFQGTPQAAKITQLLANSCDFDFGPWAGRMDFIFVDAAHDYESADSDTNTALELVNRERGVIVWHDYANWPGVLRALEERAATGGEFSKLRWIEGTTMAILDFGSSD